MSNDRKGRVICNGEYYRSQKHPLLEYIFRKHNPDVDITKNISFTLADISEAYRNIEIYKTDAKGNQTRVLEPASISNTILDLVRKIVEFEHECQIPLSNLDMT